jgi:riboflavin kinase/FMN adenylyltransferase
MEYINEFREYKSEKRTAVTLGKFDGFHRGHYALIDKIKEHSDAEVDSLLLALMLEEEAY